MHVIVDDIREEGADVIIRNPYMALDVLRAIDRMPRGIMGAGIRKLSMDNDMGTGPEGKDILYQALGELAHKPHEVVIVTSNPVAAQHMRQTLERHDYSTKDRFTRTR